MALLILTRCIQAYKVAGNIFQTTFGALFYAVPCARAQLVQLGRLAVLATVFGEFVQRVYGYKDDVLV